jgi:DNA-binding CsgD family transcriptional regulator
MNVMENTSLSFEDNKLVADAVNTSCCPHCGSRLTGHGSGGSAAAMQLLSRLSDAQRRVLFYLIAGLTEPQIATKIGRSRHTVHDHTKAIYAAMGVKRRVQLVHLFIGIEPVELLPAEDRQKELVSTIAGTPNADVTRTIITPVPATAFQPALKAG